MYFTSAVGFLFRRCGVKKMFKLSLNDDVSDQISKSYVNDEAVAKYGNDFCHERFRLLLQRLATPPHCTVLRTNNILESTENIKNKLAISLEEQYQPKNLPTPMILQHSTISDTFIIPSHGKSKDHVKHSKEVIVDLACGMAVLRGANVFAQGIMAAHPGMHVGDDVSVYSDIEGTCRKGLTEVFKGNKIFVGNGVAKISRQALYCSPDTKPPGGLGVLMTEPLYDAPSLNDLLPSLVFAQNLPSIVCGHVLNPQPGEIILDMCSAPGGKTTHIATLMKNEGRVIALEKAKNKLARIRENSKNMNLDCIEVYGCDSTKALDEGAGLDSGPPYPPEAFDRVLLDGPCSALGQRPSLKNKMTIQELNSYGKLQKKLFSVAVKLLKTSGTLVYSTCTVTLEENEMLVKWALDKYPCLVLDKQEPHIGGIGLYGAGLFDDQLKLLQRFDPSDRILERLNTTVPGTCGQSLDCNEDTIGFFIAKFVKR